MQREREKEEKKKAAEQHANENGLPLPEGHQEPEEAVGDDQGIKEPEKEPIVKIKRATGTHLLHDGASMLEQETSGLMHLRRWPLEKDRQ